MVGCPRPAASRRYRPATGSGRDRLIRPRPAPFRPTGSSSGEMHAPHAPHAPHTPHGSQRESARTPAPLPAPPPPPTGLHAQRARVVVVAVRAAARPAPSRPDRPAAWPPDHRLPPQGATLRPHRLDRLLHARERRRLLGLGAALHQGRDPRCDARYTLGPHGLRGPRALLRRELAGVPVAPFSRMRTVFLPPLLTKRVHTLVAFTQGNRRSYSTAGLVRLREAGKQSASGSCAPWNRGREPHVFLNATALVSGRKKSTDEDASAGRPMSQPDFGDGTLYALSRPQHHTAIQADKGDGRCDGDGLEKKDLKGRHSWTL